MCTTQQWAGGSEANMKLGMVTSISLWGRLYVVPTASLLNGYGQEILDSHSLQIPKHYLKLVTDCLRTRWHHKIHFTLKRNPEIPTLC